MKKNKAAAPLFQCEHCGAQTVKWTGKCLHCGQWDALKEIPAAEEGGRRGLGTGASATLLSDISIHKEFRVQTGLGEFDRVLGGGVVWGSLILIGGDPGIGKSTLLLQMATALQAGGVKTLYVSGEESPQQIKMRSERLQRRASELPVLCETELTRVLDEAETLKPRVMIIDSIQTLYQPDLTGSPGGETQLREITLKLMMYAKTSHCAVFLVGHVTKGGQIAGPKVIEHMVDTVTYFEGDPHNTFRLLRAIKNRFGATNEIGVFEMTATGLIPVENPSSSFVQNNGSGLPGSVITCSIEGSRPILLEIQALVNKSSYANAQRVAMGIDSKRLTIVLALLEKFAGTEIGFQDVFVSVAGGLRILEPAMDLAIAAAVASNHLNRPVQDKTLVLGELGLNGQLRMVSQVESRIKEALRLGFTRIVMPAPQKRVGIKAAEIVVAKNLEDALDLILK